MFCCGYDPGALLFFADPADDQAHDPLPDLLPGLVSAGLALTALGVLALAAVA